MHKTPIIILAVLSAAASLCPADPRFGSLKLTSEPDSARVFLDGTLKGTTPLELQMIKPGKHVLVVTKQGHRKYSKELMFEGGKRAVGKAVLDTLTTAEADSVKRAVPSRSLYQSESADSSSENGPPPKGKYTKVDVAPTVLSRVDPMYPMEASEFGVGGQVYIQILIDTTGSVVRAEVAKSSGNKPLDDAAVEAARQWMFTPAIAPGNKKVRVWVMQKFTFRLR